MSIVSRDKALGESAEKHANDERVDEAVQTHTAVFQPIEELVAKRKTVQAGEMNVEQLYWLFGTNKEIDHIVVLSKTKIIGLITRNYFHRQTGGRYGYSVYQRRPVQLLCQRDALTVKASMPVTALAAKAMDRQRDCLYDPVMVTDDDDNFLGTVTMKQVIQRSITLELEMAQDSNPLTGLPGNRMIQKWIDDALDQEVYTLVYGDLDRFKEYNDGYGFLSGDKMIKLAASIITDVIEEFKVNAQIGHVGGDDFIIVATEAIPKEVYEAISDKFDKRKLDLFTPEHAHLGYYPAINRAGEKVNVPMTTLSLAVIPSEQLPETTHAGHLSEVAAGLKKRVKAMTKSACQSGYLVERRDHQKNPPLV